MFGTAFSGNFHCIKGCYVRDERMLDEQALNTTRMTYLAE